MRVSILLLFVAIAICATLANPVDSKNSKDPKGKYLALQFEIDVS
jgi:hypothetical protein